MEIGEILLYDTRLFCPCEYSLIQPLHKGIRTIAHKIWTRLAFPPIAVVIVWVKQPLEKFLLKCFQLIR